MNKKILTYVLAMAFACGVTFSGNVSAKYIGPGNNIEVMTVEEVLAAPDDTLGIVEGYIVNQIDEETYTFKDLNGDTIVVEIDDDFIWPAIIDDVTLIQVNGEVDTEINAPNTFEVDYMQVL